MSLSLRNGSNKVRVHRLVNHPLTRYSDAFVLSTGFFGRTANVTSTFSIIAEDTKTISWITPMDTCPKWNYAYGGNVCFFLAIMFRLVTAWLIYLHMRRKQQLGESITSRRSLLD